MSGNLPRPASDTTAPPKRRTVQRISAWVLIVVALIFVSAGVTPSDDPESREGQTPALVMGLIMLAAGVGWLIAARRSDASGQLMYEEKAILAVASRYGGRATLAQIALETHLSMEQAEDAINRLCARNVAQPDLLDDGSVVYQFGMLN
jgi:hypothetical protein